MSDDLIKRSDAIQAIMDLPNNENGYSDTYDKQTVIYAIEDVPKTDYRWIPCSERLPEETGYYLVSGKDKVWICEMLNIMGIKGWSNNVSNPIVEYWMPLPPTSSDENDENDDS